MLQEPTPVQISCLIVYRTLKTMDIARLRAWAHLRASIPAEVSVSRAVVKLLSELLDHIPPGINVTSSCALCCCPIAAYHVISSCCASSCTPASAGGA